jgi:DNA-directed RNA polymerase III subunit RPC8
MLITLLRFSHVSDQIWIWTNEGTGEYYFDIGEVVKFRVEAEEWHDQSPGAPMQQDPTSALERKAPYSLIVILPSQLCMIVD